MAETSTAPGIRQLSDSVFFVGDEDSVKVKVMISREGKVRCMCGEYHRQSRCAHVDAVYTQQGPLRPELKKPIRRSHEVDDLSEYRNQIHSYLVGDS